MFTNSQCQALTVRFKLNDINVLVVTTIKLKPITTIKNSSQKIPDYLDIIPLGHKNCYFLYGHLNYDHSNPINRWKLLKLIWGIWFVLFQANLLHQGYFEQFELHRCRLLCSCGWNIISENNYQWPLYNSKRLENGQKTWQRNWVSLSNQIMEKSLWPVFCIENWF